MMKKKKYLSLINVISCIAVVFIHTNGCFWTFSTEGYWKTANIIECLFYFAVPCFFMITGATLMDYREKYTLKTYFQKRVKKTVIPFIFWSIIGIIYGIFVLKNIDINNLNFKYLYNGVMNSTFVGVYWFFPPLFCLYLSIPLFAAVEKSARKEVFTYLATVGFIVNVVIVLARNVWFSGYSWPVSLVAISGFLIYLVIGYLLCNIELSRKQRMLIYISAIAGFLIHCKGTYILSIEGGQIINTFKGYENAPCIMYSVGIFTWLRYNGDKIMENKGIDRIVNFIAPYTFGIYLLQYFIYTSMEMFFKINVQSIIYRLGAPFLIIPVCILIIWLIRKIPIIKHIVP